MSPAAASDPAGHLRVTQVRSGISTKPKHRATLRALGLRGVGRTRVLPDGPVLQGMLGRVRHLVAVAPASDEDVAAQPRPVRRRPRRPAHGAREERGEAMKLHELRPAPGSRRPRRRVGRGIAGKGGKTAGRGTKGTGARDTVKPGFEGGQLPLAQRDPQVEGLSQPVPGLLRSREPRPARGPRR